MIRAVLDTNIIISSLFWAGNPYEVARRGIAGEFQIVASSEILDEVADKLRVKFKFPEEGIQKLLDVFITHSHVVEATSKFDAVRDKSDNKIIACAFDGKASYIVTGDPDLLELEEFKGIGIVTAKEFTKRLNTGV